MPDGWDVISRGGCRTIDSQVRWRVVIDGRYTPLSLSGGLGLVDTSRREKVWQRSVSQSYDQATFSRSAVFGAGGKSMFCLGG